MSVTAAARRDAVPVSTHDDIIVDQFTRQAAGFAAGPELHAGEVLNLIIDAARPGPEDRAIDLACGPGSVVCAMAERAAHVVGLDATAAMLDQARRLAARRRISNVAWIEGSIYRTLFEDAVFSAVTCRFAFHHLEAPRQAFAEMVRLARPGGRIVLCDGIAPDDPEKAAALNAMERFRDPSTVGFRSLGQMRQLFCDAGLGDVEIRPFQIPYMATDLVNGSFPECGSRAELMALLEDSVCGDTMGLRSEQTKDGVRISYQAAVLCAVKPA